ncbi:LppP/LprE family lipoprotein [Mycolicibacterium sp. P9-64]|uniref:LppP/LprE family lipoprotein n=1 Tax=Mycolicibacterium sp. P9-64 TaxID=2024612 RepID=UPI0011EE31FE|nr:LppP/LprE family lipoprotein [Mycolicibacterium sp. P9-64]KAA0083510.1 LppP/LprE family lipoprotein [Mycolicibacterium sp. P9-64]
MRHRDGIAMCTTIGLLVAGCGWSPPSAPPTSSASCAQADGPSVNSVADEINQLPADQQWRETSRGHTPDCQLHWVLVGTGGASDSPQQVLFFDHDAPIGTPTPEPRPYVNVTTEGNDTAVVQYQWRQGNDQACCPTGIGTVRFKIVDGTLKALGPIPNR